MRILIVVAMSFILSGCITSLEPYYGDDHPDVISFLPEKAVIFAKNKFIRVWKKQGFEKIYESDDWDNIAVIKKIKPKRIAKRGDSSFHILQATSKKDGITYYFNVFPYKVRSIPDFDIGEKDMPANTYGIGMRRFDVQALADALERYNDPYYGNEKQVLFKTARVNGKTVKDYNMWYFDKRIHYVKHNAGSPHVIPHPYNINLDEYRKRSSPIVILDESNSEHRDIISIFDDGTGTYVNSTPEEEVRKAEWEHWVRKVCGRPAALLGTDQTGRPNSPLLQALSGMQLHPRGNQCIVKTYMEELLLFVREVSDIECAETGPYVTCTYVSHVGCHRTKSFGTNLSNLSCNILGMNYHKGVAVLEKAQDGRFVVKAMDYKEQ
ncbi:hypothetical protein [Stappia sp. ES.058]|uniref:hypothetical protein n=1 Tax=Stappia sp. ES.058 TaxID=1881061 RepID=UPI0008793787|nr:hypothetical protein [Stappia sp. ES.058]SDT98088.1 hypothetical protein SAMN05428979_0889 [Stappia sp. ES.058]